MTAETMLSVLCEIATRYDKAGKEYAPVKENPPPAATGEGASDISKNNRKDTPIL